MYLVLEKSISFYAYFEESPHHEKMEKMRRNLQRVEPVVLDDECDLSLLTSNTYMVIPVDVKAMTAKREKAKRKRKQTRGKKV